MSTLSQYHYNLIIVHQILQDLMISTTSIVVITDQNVQMTQLITSIQVLTFPTLLTSVTATSTGDFTVAFLGTGDGRLRKAVVESASSGIEYADIAIAEGTSVRSHLLFDLKRDHVYVMTDRALSKVTHYNLIESKSDF